jgi:membrane protease YdiL (CAAX protease family)
MAVGDNVVQLGLQSLAMVVIGIVVYALTRVLRFRHRAWSFAHPRDAAFWGIGAILIGWVCVSALLFAVAGSPGAPVTEMDAREYGLSDVVGQMLIALALVGPALVVMRWRRESWASAGVSTHNLVGSVVVGLVLAVLTIAGTLFGSDGSPGGVVAGLTGRHFWAFLYYVVVGFGEEFAFRGYLQTRLMGWLGGWQGWVLTSLLMAFAHLVQRMTRMGMSPLEALGSSAALIPISLFLGYVMLRTENVVAPGLAHTFANWVGTL